jgi:hypothetical protein
VLPGGAGLKALDRYLKLAGYGPGSRPAADLALLDLVMTLTGG